MRCAALKCMRHAVVITQECLQQFILVVSFLPAGHARFAFSASVSIYVSLCVRTYHMHNNYIMYIVAVRPYLSRLRQFRWLLCVATVSSLA